MLFALLALSCRVENNEPPPLVEDAGTDARASAGEPVETVPDARLADLDAIVSAVEERRGQPVVINVWATFCPPCVREMPVFVDLYEERRGEVGLVSLSGDLPYELEDTVKPFMQERGIPFPVLLAEPTPDRIAEALDLPEWDGALPATFVLDSQGAVTDYWLEEITAAQLEEALAKLESAEG